MSPFKSLMVTCRKDLMFLWDRVKSAGRWLHGWGRKSVYHQYCRDTGGEISTISSPNTLTTSLCHSVIHCVQGLVVCTPGTHLWHRWRAFRRLWKSSRKKSTNLHSFELFHAEQRCVCVLKKKKKIHYTSTRLLWRWECDEHEDSDGRTWVSHKHR